MKDHESKKNFLLMRILCDTNNVTSLYHLLVCKLVQLGLTSFALNRQ